MPGETLVITSTRVVLDGECRPASIVTREGCIVAVEPGTVPSGGADVQNLRDLVILPGLVDAHVHVNEPGRTDWEGFRTAGLAAAAGGVTTMVVMPLNCTPAATNAEALLAEARAANGQCLVDYGLWGGLVHRNAEHLEPMHRVGALGFKCFLTDSGVDDFPRILPEDLETAAPIARDLGVPILVHAEDPEVIAASRGRSGLDDNPRSYAAYLASRPPEAEDRAIAAVIDVARRHGCRVHIVHVASASALRLIAEAKAAGVPITAETCPHYLALCAEEIPDGRIEYKCAPPIRGRAVQNALWGALQDGTLGMIASDHSPCPPELKRPNTGDFESAWGGISGLQLTLSVVLSRALERGLGVADLPRWVSECPARLAGLPRKGRIAPGYDADLVAVDPDASWVVRPDLLHHRHKITPYTGSTLAGVVRKTILRGVTIFDADAPRPHPSDPIGQWLKPKPA